MRISGFYDFLLVNVSFLKIPDFFYTSIKQIISLKIFNKIILKIIYLTNIYFLCSIILI